MIIQDNEFLKTYNDISKLWEDVSEESSVTSRKTEFKFTDVAEQAIDDIKALSSGLSEDQINYWCDLRALLEDKRYRIGDVPSGSWYDRFMRFYKAYLVESAIKDWFNKLPTGLGIVSCSFGDDTESDHHLLKPDASLGQAKPDLKVLNENTEYYIECKSCNATSSLHGAKLVARYESIDNTDCGDLNVKFWLVGKEAANQKNAAYTLFSEGGPTVHKITQSLKGEFDPSGKDPTAIVKIQLPKTSIYKALEQINNYLDTQDTAQKIKTAYIFNKTTKNLDKIAKQELNLNLSDKTLEEPKDPANAADQLADVVNTIAAAVQD